MSKKILAVVSSPRKGGNSETLVARFTVGAKEAGHTVETLFLREKKIAPCIACEACLKNGGTCVQKDDMAEIIEKIVAADGKQAMERTMNDMQGFADCVPGSVVKGKIYGSAFHIGDIQGNPALEEAYTFGKSAEIV